MSEKKPTILVVEDEKLLLEAITKKLKISSITAIGCSTVDEATDYLENTNDLPDAIWLDYYLKETSGLDFMMQLKGNPQWEKIPVIIVSNSASQDTVKKMMALGASKYVLKTDFRLDEIINMFKELIDAKE